MQHSDNNFTRISYRYQDYRCIDVCFNMLPKHMRRHAGSYYGARKPADVAVTLWSVEGLLGLYRENAIAIESEAGYSLNV